jgi:hypothetical protein
VLPHTEKEFSLHSWQVLFPEPFLYVPVSHNSHVCPSSPVAPGKHLQSVRNPDFTEELEFGGHNWQVGLPISDQVQVLHSLHVSIPVAPQKAE